jgi:hypothetical protein
LSYVPSETPTVTTTQHAVRLAEDAAFVGDDSGATLPWIKGSVALGYVLSFPWVPEAWHEVRQHIQWLLAE